jgi:hypothetical protein
MKKGFLLLLFFASVVCANEPQYSGTYLNGTPNKFLAEKSWVGYPSNNASSAGSYYLLKNKINSVNYISKQKGLFITQAKEEAKQFAVREEKGAYAVIGLSFQVIRTEKSTELYADYTVAAW